MRVKLARVFNKIMKYKKKKVIFTLAIFLVLIVSGIGINVGPIFVLGATSDSGDYVPLSLLPGTESSPGSGAVNFGSYVLGMFKLLIGAAAVLAVIMIMIGGVTYISTDAIADKSDGKKIIFRAIFGLIITIASWVLLNGINPTILRFDILKTTPGVPEVPGTSEIEIYHKFRFCWKGKIENGNRLVEPTRLADFSSKEICDLIPPKSTPEEDPPFPGCIESYIVCRNFL